MVVAFGVRPMKASLGSLPAATDDERWAYEIKWDGYRTVAHVSDRRVRLQSSNSIDVTAKYPELAPLAGAIDAAHAVLDGELVALDPHGRPSFELLQRHEVQVAFYAFDLLALNGHDTIGLAYEDRRSLLEQVLDSGSNWAVPAHRVGGGAELVAVTAEQGLEGIMAKRLGSTYIPGSRTPSWRKIKHRRSTQVVIGGFSAGTGSREATFGSLLVGVVGDDGALRFAGGVGTGFDQRTLDMLDRAMRARIVSTCPFTPPPPREVARDATWVAPELVAEIEIAEWTNIGVVRHASFIRLVT